ncbi:AAA family ATPase [Paenibacillus hodogayensis]|uniref:Uncharacterized AAA domain-containing protein ycf46 n=1 Tax=Paenibacillus hodogayensis TaxID=279208 RepID=A0ABV5VWG0_9BACL
MKPNIFLKELEYLIRARYSVIYVDTIEEERALQLVEQVGSGLGKRIVTWTCTRGLELNGKIIDKTADFRAALHVAGELAKEPTLFVWFDLHPYMKEYASPVPIRAFREFSQQIRSGLPSNSIVISPAMDIPPELQKEITILDLPLPELEEVKQIIIEFADVYQDKPGVTIDRSKEIVDALARAAVGLTRAEIENCLAKALVKDRSLSVDDVAAMLEEKRQIIRKSGILEYVATEHMQLDDIGGLQNLKRWLERRRASYTEEARTFGIDWPKGVLLVGVPGCGKSLCAKSVAAAWQMPLLRLDLGRVFSGLVGSSEANMRTALAMCEAVSPSIVWIDEIEKALAGSRQGSSDGGTATRVFGTLLTWMQEKKSPVFIFATANDIAKLPPELLRKGRFDEIFFVDLPNEEERREIFHIHLSRLQRDPARFDLDRLVELSGETRWGEAVRLTGSEIEAAVREGLLEAYYRRTAEGDPLRDLETADIVSAIERSVPLARMRGEDIREMRDWASQNAVRASAPAAGTAASSLAADAGESTVGRSIDF